MMQPRAYSFFDKLCLNVDQAIRALTNNAKTTGVTYPAGKGRAESLTETERKQSAALMRVNHAGEICAQALYHGQGVVSKTLSVQEKMQQAALEEGDHLAWCQQRLQELNSHPSYLNPLWYAGSFCIGMVAGMVGDKWSLGFLAETEQQVVKHLEKHLHLLPAPDTRSQQILKRMQEDESAHRDDAVALGAYPLPSIVKRGMAAVSNIMVKTAYWI